MKKKIKQYSFWTGLSGAVVILLTTLSKAFGFEFQQEIVADIIMGVCGVLVVFGVVSAPLGDEKNTEQPEENQDQNQSSQSKKTVQEIDKNSKQGKPETVKKDDITNWETI